MRQRERDKLQVSIGSGLRLIVIVNLTTIILGGLCWSREHTGCDPSELLIRLTFVERGLKGNSHPLYYSTSTFCGECTLCKSKNFSWYRLGIGQLKQLKNKGKLFTLVLRTNGTFSQGTAFANQTGPLYKTFGWVSRKLYLILIDRDTRIRWKKISHSWDPEGITLNIRCPNG